MPTRGSARANQRKGQRRRVTKREADYLKARAGGMDRVPAVFAAGYQPSTSNGASAIGGKIERKVTDLGLLHERLAERGVDQDAIAETLADALHGGTVEAGEEGVAGDAGPKEAKLVKHEIGVRLRAAEFAAKLLGYERRQADNPTPEDLPLDDIAAASIAIVRELKRRGLEQNALGPVAGGRTPP